MFAACHTYAYQPSQSAKNQSVTLLPLHCTAAYGQCAALHPDAVAVTVRL